MPVDLDAAVAVRALDELALLAQRAAVGDPVSFEMDAHQTVVGVYRRIPSPGMSL